MSIALPSQVSLSLERSGNGRALVQQSFLGGLLFTLYRFRAFRPGVRWLLDRLEGGMMFSQTYRRIYQAYYGVEVGTFTYGPGLKPGVFPSGTKIGGFCSLADSIAVMRRNHPMDRVSQHPIFYNRRVGFISSDSIAAVQDNPLEIGSDVWIGYNVIICPGCKSIGNGAIIGAGSVVTKDVPPYTVVAGNPARPIRKRFTPKVEEVVAASQWWLRPLPELVQNLNLFTQEITDESTDTFSQAFPPARGQKGNS